MIKRQFTPYEFNQLNKHGFNSEELAEKVDSNMPVEYVTGFAEFRGTDFIVNNNVLIPRVETEEIIDLAIENLKDKQQINFADIGTGSGAIGISFTLELIKKELPFDGYLSDLSKKALEVTKRNVDKILDPQHQNCFTNKVLNSQIKVIQSDLFSEYPKSKKFDVIFANLPYIPTERIYKLDNSVKDFEPIQALDGGVDGFQLVRKLIDQAPNFLKKDGILILEVDDTHTSAREFLDMWSVEIKTDSLGNNRFWVMRLR